MHIDWKRKLSSRKLWAAAIGFITPLLLTFGISEEAVTQLVGIVMSGITLIAYILGEGLVDAGHIGESEEGE